jgi:hypothetical protein
MNPSENLIIQYLRFTTDINRNLSNIIHLTNNLRYNTFQVLNNYTNSRQLTNDIFFPPVVPPPPPPLDPPPMGRRRLARSRRPRVNMRNGRLYTPPSALPTIFTPSPATSDEINQATESLLYSDISSNHHMCPISQQNFEPTDRVLRIRHCGHIFTEQTLRQWFRTSYECPVCRFDIRQRTASNIDSILRSIATQTIAPRDISSNVIDPSNNNFAYSFTVGGFIT